MPATYRIDTDLGVVFTEASGIVTDQDLLNNQDSLRSDRNFRPNLKKLADFRAVTDIEVTAAGVRALAAANPFGANSKCAMVTDNITVFGLGRMFELVQPYPKGEFRLFHSISEARAWLGLLPEE